MTPSTDVWAQFPLVGVILACFAAAAIAVFQFTKWVWGEYLKSRAEDMAWRERQNMAREANVAEQNRLWREAMTDRDARYEKFDRERQSALTQLAQSILGIAKQLEDHDAQAVGIKATVDRIDQNTKPK